MNVKQTQITEVIIKVLNSFGIPANWAKVLGGAIAGAAIAAYALTLSSCGMSITASVKGDAYQLNLSQQQATSGSIVEVFLEVEEAK